MQNAAARVLTTPGNWTTSHIFLNSLHWLLMSQRIHFEILLLVYNSRNGLGPKYIQDVLRNIQTAGMSDSNQVAPQFKKKKNRKIMIIN